MDFLRHEMRTGELELNKNPIKFNYEMSGLKVELSYYNNLPHAVTIGLRDGTYFDLIPRNNSNLPRQLIITKTVSFDRSCVLPRLPDPITDKRNRIVYDTYTNVLSKSSKNVHAPYFYQVEMQYTIEQQDLNIYNTYYLNDLDVVVSTERDFPWHHPCSPDGERNSHLNNITAASGNYLTDPRSFTFDVQIVAPEGFLKEKYVNINNFIYRVPIITKGLKEHGIYISYNGRTDLKTAPTKPIVDRYDLDELTKPYTGKDASKLPIRFFNTIQEAMGYGDVSKQREHELEQLKHSKALIEQENALLKTEQAKNESERKKISDELDSLLKEREKIREDLKKEFENQRAMEAAQRQHEYKMKEADRKDTSDILKWVPTMIGGILAILSLFIKVQTAK